METNLWRFNLYYKTVVSATIYKNNIGYHLETEVDLKMCEHDEVWRLYCKIKGGIHKHFLQFNRTLTETV